MTTNSTIGPWRMPIAIAAAAVLAAGAGLASAEPARSSGWSARAVLQDVNGRRVGTVRFDGDRRATQVTIELRGVGGATDAFHGVHLHANPDGQACDAAAVPAFGNVGPHWNPTGVAHGGHIGDLPPVLVDARGNGVAEVRTTRIDPAGLAGRAVIVHAGPDNLANIPVRYTSGDPPVAGPDTATAATGDAGDRIACGIVVGG